MSPYLEGGGGITNVVTGNLDGETGRAVCGVGGTPPLDLEQIISLLLAEAEKANAVFEAFETLVGEQTVYISAKQTEFEAIGERT